jgi:hypothetical protein
MARQLSEESKFRQYLGEDVIYGSDNIKRICTHFQKFVDARNSKTEQDVKDLKTGYLSEIRSRVVAVDTF